MLLVNILPGYPDGGSVNYYGLSVVKTRVAVKKNPRFFVMRWGEGDYSNNSQNGETPRPNQAGGDPQKADISCTTSLCNPGLPPRASPLKLFAFLGVLRNDHITRLETLKAGQTNWIR